MSVANSPDTKFAIASMTKMFTAMAALVLAEQGHIGLHKRPADYVPELMALDERITIHHLLSHTAGLRDVYEVPNLEFEVSKLRHDGGDLLDFLAAQPHLFPPGHGWGYSSTGYLLERVTGEAFGDLMARRMCSPLAMSSTGIIPLRINPGRASGHAVEDGQVVNAGNDDLSIFEEAPGELYSTAKDLRRWCDATSIARSSFRKPWS